MRVDAARLPPHAVLIRHMEDADAEDVSVLLTASWRRTYEPLVGKERVADKTATLHRPDRLREELADPLSASFVAVASGGGIAGCAFDRKDRSGELWFDRLHVDPRWFGKGVAADLLHAVLAAFVGESSISVEVIRGNDRALAFYRKQGFEIAESHSHCGSLDVPATILRRPLSRA
jgi:ribosomal protein S18 acetylase RimI-like enzyme